NEMGCLSSSAAAGFPGRASILPEPVETVGAQLRISHRVHDVAVVLARGILETLHFKTLKELLIETNSPNPSTRNSSNVATLALRLSFSASFAHRANIGRNGRN